MCRDIYRVLRNLGDSGAGGRLLIFTGPLVGGGAISDGEVCTLAEGATAEDGVVAVA